ncbi:hypothetical protein I302_102593 [Kwoniella bestiolae CBS 10118]|uniref:Uncharacterized protein n=1 Tax=Kwoniella bestiolae CBS 10118 TaxID=1296100 RepID=A0A1B9GFD8_9TREE|nr:hypothetical protein I302_01280 [Kwoniella bestiolae CBS 10118]OCF29767.1 hypothetical protein I302_01280 [Kwoniella bestiolae CBS 10118]
MLPAQSQDPLSVFRSRQPTPTGFRPPPPVTPSPARSSHPNSSPRTHHHSHSQIRYPILTPTVNSSSSSQHRPGDDVFSPSYQPPSSTSRHGTPSLSQTIPTTGTARTGSVNAKAGPSQPSQPRPRTAQEVFEEGQKKKLTGVDKILARLDAMDKRESERDKQASEREQQASARDTKWNQKIDKLDKEISTLRTDNRQLRDQIHELKLGQNSLATRDEMVEEITNQMLTTVGDLQDRITNLPIELAAKIVTPLPHPNHPPTQQQFSDAASVTALTNLLNHVTTKLNGIDSLITLLGSLQGLPEAITSVAVFKEALDGLTSKVEEFSQHSQPGSQPALVTEISPPTPKSPCISASSGGPEDKNKKTHLLLSSIVELCQKHITGQEEIRSILTKHVNTFTRNDLNRPIEHSSRPLSVPPFEATQPNSLEALAEAAAARGMPGNAQVTPPIDHGMSETQISLSGDPVESIPPNFTPGVNNRSHQRRFSSLASPPPADFSFGSSLSFSDAQPMTSTPFNRQRQSANQSTSAPRSPFNSLSFGATPTRQSTKSNPSSQRATKKAKVSPDPSDRPVTRSMSNRVSKPPIKWGPTTHKPIPSNTNKSKKLGITSKSSSRATILGKSVLEAIEISDTSSHSPPDVPSRASTSRTSSVRSKFEDIAQSVLFSQTPIDNNSLSSGVESVPQDRDNTNGLARVPPVRVYASTGAKSRLRAREAEEARNRGRTSYVPTLGSSVGQPLGGGNPKGKRRMEVDFDDSL